MANDNWGSLARFGLFIVGSEAVPEAEWWAMVPPGVSIHAARITAATPWAKWSENRDDVMLAPDVERGAVQFASMDLSAVVLAHSSSSIVGGSGWDDAVMASLRPRLRQTTAVTTNGMDCVSALRACGVRRPFIVYPAWFGEKVMTAGSAYFSDLGFERIQSFRHLPEQKWTHLRPEDLYKNLMHMEQNSELLFDQIVAECPSAADRRDRGAVCGHYRQARGGAPTAGRDRKPGQPVVVSPLRRSKCIDNGLWSVALRNATVLLIHFATQLAPRSVSTARIHRPILASTHLATISPGTPSSARSASRSRLSRFGSLTWDTSRKIGTVKRPRPVFERDATPSPRLLSRPSATSRLGPQRR